MCKSVLRGGLQRHKQHLKEGKKDDNNEEKNHICTYSGSGHGCVFPCRSGSRRDIVVQSDSSFFGRNAVSL
jgi:hypothetical protein